MRLKTLVETSNGGLIRVPPVGSDPEVRAVVTTDLLDPGRYLTGGELVLTGLVWWRADQPERSDRFVAALAGAGAAALAAGEAQLGAVPDELVAACARAGLPLLRVPVAVSFAAVTERIYRALVGHDDLISVLARHRAMVAAVVDRSRLPAGSPERSGSSGLSAVLAVVGADLDLTCSVLAPTGALIAHSAGPDPTGTGGSVADPGGPAGKERRRLVRAYLRAPTLPLVVTRPGGAAVTLFGDPAGPRTRTWLLTVDGDHRRWSPERRAAVDELAALIAAERGLAVRRSDVEHRLAAALQSTDADDAATAARRCGLELDRAAVVVLGRGGGPVVPLLTDALGEWYPGRAWALGEGPEPGEAVAVVPAESAGEVVGALRAVLALLAPGLGPRPVRLGVSDPVTGGAGLLAAAGQARAVLGAAPAAGTGGWVAGPERLSSHAALLAGVPPELRSAYRGRVLGPLLEHDRAHRTELVRTLAAYLDCSGSWSRCAAGMNLHVNTLRYRIEKIEALTGRDLRRLPDQVDLLLALDRP